MKQEILIIDIETTGFFKDKGKIVEIGIVSLNIETGHREILFEKVVHERPITKNEVDNSWIVTKGYMSTKEIQESKQLKEYHADIQRIISQYPLGATAFNNVFDFEFMEDRGFVFHKKLDCPMKIMTSMCKLPGKYGKYKWPNVMEAFGFLFPDEDYDEIHRGADDAYHEAKIVYELIKRGQFKIEK